VKKKVLVDYELLRAFHYFDRDTIGYIKTDDLETILHCSGQNLSSLAIRNLITKCADPNLRRVTYKKLVEREEIEVLDPSSLDQNEMQQ